MRLHFYSKLYQSKTETHIVNVSIVKYIFTLRYK
nr:MAG TPA: hypothetical protein [Caudoviricetes sp.]